ncbi:MAG: dihydrodipicolinate synthase family protein [SAR202 cluster bacterium]|nr:dihydrodipicolinate synthase family protein [SAR202 cluster bacterium]
MANKPTFEGIYPAIITPMTEKGEVHEEAFRAMLEDNIRCGIHGFWTAGGTGESVMLTDEENTRIAKIAADQNKGRSTIIMHVGAITTDRAVKNAENAAKAGVEALCAVPPFFVRPGDDAVVEHYRAIGAATNLPLMVYNLPQATQIEITVDLMKKLQDKVPQMVGLKHSALNFNNMIWFSEMGLKVLTGSGMLLFPALTVGASGTVDGPPSVAPELWMEIWNAWKAGDLKRGVAAQRKANDLFNLILKYGYMGSMKAMISERTGIECGNPRRPVLPMSAENRKAINKVCEEWGITGAGKHDFKRTLKTAAAAKK